MASSVEKDDLEEDNPYDCKTSLKAAKGPILSLLSTILYALSAECMALASKGGIPSLQLIFIMRLAQIFTVLVCIPFFRPRLTGDNKLQTGKLILSAVVKNVANALVYVSFTYAAPSIVFGMIQGSLPLLTGCIGLIILHETLSLVSSCGILTCASGVVLIAVGMGNQDANSTQSLVMSILLPLAAVLFKAPDTVIVRALLKNLSGLTMMLWAASFGAVATIILTYTIETPIWTMSVQTAVYVVGLAVTGSLDTMLCYAVLEVEKAAIAISLRTLVVPITILMDYYFQSTVQDPLKWTGLSLVLIGTVVLSINTWWKHRQEDKHKILLEKLDFSQTESNAKET